MFNGLANTIAATGGAAANTIAATGGFVANAGSAGNANGKRDLAAAVELKGRELGEEVGMRVVEEVAKEVRWEA